MKALRAAGSVALSRSRNRSLEAPVAAIDTHLYQWRDVSEQLRTAAETVGSWCMQM